MMGDEGMMERLEHEARRVDDVTTRTIQRRDQITQDLMRVRNNAVALVMAWREVYAPSTVQTYVGTLLQLYPEWRGHETFMRVVRRVRQDGGVMRCARAIPMTPSHVRQVVTKCPREVVSTVLWMWLTASRYADLHVVWAWRVVAEHPHYVIVELKWNVWKSDRTGMRAFGKFIDVHNTVRRCMQQALVPYRDVLRWMKVVEPHLTVHSVRRGAATELANAGCDMEQIGLMTGHTPQKEQGVNVRRYVDAHWSQPEARAQRHMSRLLSEVVTGPLQW
jgi:hypothetical protein